MNLDQRNNSKLIWMIAAGLVVILLLIVVFLWLNNTNSTTEQTKQSAIPVAQPAKTPQVAQPLEETVASTPAIESNQALVNESILKDEVPQNESLAKEEVARLDDIQKQLDEQAKILKSQHADAD